MSEANRESPSPQPYSRHLRAIAALIAARRSDADCLREISRYLEACGVPVPPPRGPEDGGS